MRVEKLFSVGYRPPETSVDFRTESKSDRRHRWNTVGLVESLFRALSR